jgi:hypothetical protein
MKSIDFQSLRPVTLSIPTVSTRLNSKDYWGAAKVRWGFGRNNYRVTPGLYKAGKPTAESDVFISANYKLSFDTLRKNLDSLNAWILVIDTKGINVWCAAGKGTFGTNNLVRSIQNASLEHLVKHRNIIVPQLGATGIAPHQVRELTGFRVIYGPIHAKDIKPFIQAGYKASPSMRKIGFPFMERAKLIPMDFMYGKYKLLMVLSLLFFLSGLDKTGFLFAKMLETCFSPLINIGGAYFAGIVVAPLFLPWVPFRAFALKGAFWGVICTLILTMLLCVSFMETIALGFMNISVASFMTMNFTGSSTYTSLSGVKIEMKWAVPIQIVFAGAGLILFIISKLV